MCLYTKFVENPRYKPNKKNKGIPPKITDIRVKSVPIKCGWCYECRKAISNEWRIRLQEENRNSADGKMVTLTFNERSLKILESQANSEEANEVATFAVRRFLERWRKHTGKSVKHFFITELGHQNTERIHLHGIIWSEKDEEFIKECWHYGISYIDKRPIGKRAINYIIKYITKLDKDHEGYKQKILCSKGLGATFKNDNRTKDYVYKGENTNEQYRQENGQKTAMPIYYRNHIYSDEEKEQLWIKKMDKAEMWLSGTKYRMDKPKEVRAYQKALEYQQKKNKQMGFGTSETKKKQYMTKKGKIKFGN